MVMKQKLLFIGAGRMAEAIIAGIVKTNPEAIGSITVANQTNQDTLHRLEETYGVATTTVWMSEVESHDAIILATPPHTHDAILRDLARVIDHKLVLTVAAGIDPAYMEERLPSGTPTAWIMPNTAAQVGESMSTYTCGEYVTAKHRELIQAILDAIGYSEEFPPQLVHDLTAITGSAPAFLYHIADALEKAAESYDISQEQARELVIKMMKGSIAMLEEGHEPKDLIAQVASPGGSTAQGLLVLKERQVQEAFKEAVIATNKHARGAE
ncbi:pyrroline-5-carboxylate reductase [Paenalkalicoccus suaedae]|uniref:Pyrroline-5-carboxylate reductase n=1 Tax=Paenalkalicoccus suaedae TaxID=2592382 RepID=A0A859FH43_9BACI|nr:pyrroline-5-carboxylate reductase [Paenalkalicoccus suaedae]QKS72120.1 pyrroline-5-carboxylate reductase [Paenalkalicoccus suaedae]